MTAALARRHDCTGTTALARRHGCTGTMARPNWYDCIFTAVLAPRMPRWKRTKAKIHVIGKVRSDTGTGSTDSTENGCERPYRISIVHVKDKNYPTY